MLKIYYIVLLFLGLHIFTIKSHAQEDFIQNPVKNFEQLWSTFDLRYANFALKKVDWKQVYKKYRPQITDTTSNQELFAVCCSMLQELNDGHVSMDPKFSDEEVFCGPPYDFAIDQAFPDNQTWMQFEKLMNQCLQQHDFSPPITFELSEETHFQFRTSPNLGYLRMDEMTEEATFGRLGRALDQALAAFQDKNGVIIDLRFNGGGWDVAAYNVAARFVNKKQIGHYKKTRKKGTQEFTKLQPWYLKPKGSIQFTKSIIILTSDFTASAAEVFILALQQFPYVTLVGDTTEGIFSDMYEFKLPNGWEVSLSHQQFFSQDMKNYEGIGLAPHYKVVNSRADLSTGKDPVIDKAIEVLKKKMDAKR